MSASALRDQGQPGGPAPSRYSSLTKPEPTSHRVVSQPLLSGVNTGEGRDELGGKQRIAPGHNQHPAADNFILKIQVTTHRRRIGSTFKIYDVFMKI